MVVAGLAVAAASMPDSLLPISEVLWSPEAHHNYSGTPSIILVPGSTEYLVSYESFDSGPPPECMPGPDFAEFGRSSIKSMFNATTPHFTRVLASPSIDGAWQVRGAVQGLHFATLFRPSWDCTPTTVFMIGTQSGPLAGANSTAPVTGIAVARSNDSGRSWSSAHIFDGEYTSGATPAVEWGGRIWRAIEFVDESGTWPSAFQAMLVSAPVGSNLLDAASWTKTSALPFNSAWITQPWTGQAWTGPGYLEGNAVPVVSEGNTSSAVHVFLRVNSLPYSNVAMLLRQTDNETALTNVSMVAFPGGMSKFTIRFDAVSRMYVTLSNNVTNTSCPSMRSQLSLACSPDLLHWRAVKLLLESDSGLSAYDKLRYSGFHYVDWQFDGASDMVAAIRTAYRGANSYHNSNRITTLRVVDFRQYFQDCPTA